MENQQSTKKWYEKRGLLILLFFIFPPLGIYGMLQRKTATWKKILYAFPFSSFILIFLIGAYNVATTPDYDYAMRHYHEQDYEKAYNYFLKVSSDDKNYTDAQTKLKEIKFILDSIKKEKYREEIRLALERNENIQMLRDRKEENAELQKEKEILITEVQKKREMRLEKLKGFQKFWADSILASESKVGNRHFVATKLSLPDTILFEYTENVTKKGFEENMKIDTSFYRKYYKEQVKEKLGKDFENHKVYISFIPNRNVDLDKIRAENRARAERKEKIERRLYYWESSLKKYIKNSMNDPSSFSRIETTYSDKGSYIMVYMTFRGKNAFGAYVVNQAVAKVDENGNILSVSVN